MKTFLGMAVFVFLALVALPFMGFWIVGIIGVFGILLICVAVGDIFFPLEEWIRGKVERFFTKKCSLSEK